MSKFIYIYNGPATPMDQFNEEQSAKEMAAWGAWMGKGVWHALMPERLSERKTSTFRGGGVTSKPSSVRSFPDLKTDSLSTSSSSFQRNATATHPVFSTLSVLAEIAPY